MFATWMVVSTMVGLIVIITSLFSFLGYVHSTKQKCSKTSFLLSTRCNTLIFNKHLFNLSRKVSYRASTFIVNNYICACVSGAQYLVSVLLIINIFLKNICW